MMSKMNQKRGLKDTRWRAHAPFSITENLEQKTPVGQVTDEKLQSQPNKTNTFKSWPS